VPVLGHWRWSKHQEHCGPAPLSGDQNVIERDYQLKLAWDFHAGIYACTRSLARAGDAKRADRELRLNERCREPDSRHAFR
jgi:hypothetical protein